MLGWLVDERGIESLGETFPWSALPSNGCSYDNHFGTAFIEPDAVRARLIALATTTRAEASTP
jgi:hypothetical protein